jgi:excinuclease ABC subunit A
MTVSEGLDFFKAVPSIKDKLETMNRVGLGYIKIGQQATTLSGGEAQRIKLSKELSKRATGKTIYILDEPTTGLHFEDIRKLLEVLDQLVSYGNTVIVIEHNLDVIKTADWIIDLGPDGGDKGGKILAEGTPEDLSKIKKSYTGQFLKRLL